MFGFLSGYQRVLSKADYDVIAIVLVDKSNALIGSFICDVYFWLVLM